MDDKCPICNGFIDVICSGYSRTPFVDGKKYKMICQFCYETPKSWEYDEKNDKIVILPISADNLHTAESLFEELFSGKPKKNDANFIRCKNSVSSIKKSIKKKKPN